MRDLRKGFDKESRKCRVSRMKNGKKEKGAYDCVAWLYELYEKKMYIVAYSILKNQWQAEDAVSEAFIKIIRHRDAFRDPESDETKRYIIRLIQNTAIDIYRKNQRDSEHLQVLDGQSDQVCSQSVPDTDMVVLEMHDRQQVKELLCDLPEKLRQVMLLRCVKELSVKETAAVLQIKESAVRKRYERARTLLKDKLGEGRKKEDRRQFGGEEYGVIKEQQRL